MTIETRICFGISELKTFTFVCQHCKAALSHKLSELRPEHLAKCPVCGKVWIPFTQTEQRVSIDPIGRFLEVIRDVSAIENHPAVRIVFDIPAPDAR